MEPEFASRTEALVLSASLGQMCLRLRRRTGIRCTSFMLKLGWRLKIVEGPDFVVVTTVEAAVDFERRYRAIADSPTFVLAFQDCKTIDHLILRHPHRDDVELLPDLFDNYAVRNTFGIQEGFTISAVTGIF